jgi:hypothetical protein
MRLHVFAGLLVAVIIPAASRLAGSGRLAWTMYSKTQPYRLRLAGTTVQGAVKQIPATSVAALARGHAGVYLAGAEQWRPIAAGPLLRDHLTEIASLACRLEPFVTIQIELLVRPNLDAPAQSTIERVTCER